MKETGSTSGRGENSITITGTEKEVNMLRRMMCSGCWLGTREGSIGGEMEARDKYKPLPDQVDDPMIPPRWQVQPPAKYGGTTKRPVKMRLAEHLDPDDGWHSPSIIIQHLCGYYNTPENYAIEAARLQSLGFECLRSRRDDDGKFWELWLLPFLLMAEGDLKKVVEKTKGLPWNKQSEEVVNWLCRNCSYGSLDVCVQRSAMSLGDE